ncbi:uncharacterized protein BX664DRAFT_348219 [Halteromyces radiatus]|uniref:uncharacterized protein n=1 Tax=Halteromyces radiatus TaxID=101107 RepID=UPI00221FA8A3|nr:uncharacterized protein BX664DRAFT_348219 [Halteromyces radiatus]KAI8092971.1 hypothetical protein BX664DRAFT_348219 [Halteromyces radiatus]
MENTWSQYKEKPDNIALYTTDATVTHVPTGVTIQSNTELRKFYLSKSTTIAEQVHNQVISGNKIMEEVDWVVTFKQMECNWLLPNLDEHYYVNSTIKIPVVISAQFENDLIARIRIYWDQASVLKQLNVISQRNKWPVIGAEQVNALRVTGSNPTSPTPSTELPAKFNPGQNAFVPGRIFGPVHPDDQVRHSIRKPDENAPNRNIFSYEPPKAKPLVAHNPNRLGSSFTLAHDEGTRPTTSNESTPPVTRKPKSESRNIFAQYDDDLSKKTSQLNLNGTRNIIG